MYVCPCVHHAPDAPVFSQPDDETLELSKGEEVSLNCTAVGSPPPTYSWSTSVLSLEKMEDQAVLISSALRPGTYTCTASNILGKKSKQFIIKPKP